MKGLEGKHCAEADDSGKKRAEVAAQSAGTPDVDIRGVWVCQSEQWTRAHWQVRVDGNRVDVAGFTRGNRYKLQGAIAANTFYFNESEEGTSGTLTIGETEMRGTHTFDDRSACRRVELVCSRR